MRQLVSAPPAGESPAQTTARIVSRLHREVRYTGVEFGEAQIIPQFPSETLKRKFGDCKDKAALLVAMLRASGLPAYIALLSAGPGRDVPAELPGFGHFDHAIVYVPGAQEMFNRLPLPNTPA